MVQSATILYVCRVNDEYATFKHLQSKAAGKQDSGTIYVGGFTCKSSNIAIIHSYKQE